jgi:hypothetical protein
MNAAASAVHVSVSLVTVDDDSPALLPRNCPSAGTKSPLDRPCRYSSGSTSLTCGVLRAHGGRIAEENRIRSPEAGSVRLSFTRGAVTSTAPALVSTVRGPAVPLRTTRRRPSSSRSPANWPMYAATSACSAAASICRAPSRTIWSISDDGSPAGSAAATSGTTVSMGVPFPASVAPPAIA